MAIADMLPTLDDASLATLKSNATRLQAGGDAAKQKQAEALLPLIEAELAEREAKKSPKAVRAKAAAKPKVTKAKAPATSKAKPDEELEPID